MTWPQPSTEPLPDHVQSIPFDGHLVLVRDDCEVIVLNETAHLIWNEIARGAAAAEVARGIADRFAVPSERALADVEAALADWRARGLIEHRPSDRPSAARRRRRKRPPSSGFTADCTYALQGRSIRFRFRDPDVEDLIRPLLTPWEVSEAAACEVIDLYRDGADHVIAADGAEIGRDRFAEEMLGLAMGRVLEASYPDARWLAVFHAGAVADPRHAIVMPGVSGSGKSTLTAALVHTGLRYLSDDVVPLDGRTSRVLPVPLASSVKQGSWPVLAARFPDLDRLPTYCAAGRARRYLDLSASARDITGRGMPVRALVFPRYRQLGPTQLEALRPGQALERLLQAHCWISLDRADLAGTLRWVLATPAYSLQYNAIEEAIAIVRGLLAG
jgi:Coenzyme PQQ synthesis protein D (PqqD)